MTYYFNKDNKQIRAVQWNALRKRPDYCIVREFENDRIYAKVEWYGVVPDSRLPESERKIFRLVVENIVRDDPNGVPYEDHMGNPAPKRYPDPDASGTFVTAQEAINVYEDLLVRYGDCEWLTKEDGKTVFLDVGNKIEPPKPKTADTPSVTDTPNAPAAPSVDVAGSW